MARVKTYRQLAEALKTLTSEQLNSDITVGNGYTGEAYAADFRTDGHETLDPGHPVIHFKGE